MLIVTFYIFQDEKLEKESNLPIADAHVVVYSVTSRRSFLRALDILSLVQKSFRRSAVVLVGNKSDLVRVRAVTTDGKESCIEKFLCNNLEGNTINYCCRQGLYH